MDDYSINLNLLDSSDPEQQLTGLAFFAACNDNLLTDAAITRLIHLAENAQKHVSDVAASIISQAVTRREREAVARLVLKKLKTGRESEIAQRDLEWAVKIKTPEMKYALESYLDRCSEPKHISWLVKNLPREYPDQEQAALLKSFLTYGDDRIVSNTIEGLEYLNDPGLVAVFAQMLHHASHRVRSVAASAISRANPERARKILFSMLQQPENTEAIKAACHAIKHISGGDFLDLVMPLLNNRYAKEEAARTIAWLGYKKISSIFDHEALKNRHEMKSRVSASIIELLREQCRRSSFLQADEDTGADGAFNLIAGDKSILAFDPVISPKEAKKLAEENKHRSLSFFSRIIYRPKDEEIQLTMYEARYQPFWQIGFAAKIEYVRERQFKIELDSQVNEIKIGDQYFKASDGRVCLNIDEKCSIERSEQIFIDAVSGNKTDFQELMQRRSRKLASIAELEHKDFAIIPARVKASIPVRNMILEIMQPLKAIEIISQNLEIEKLNLCFRPVYVFAYSWKERNQSVAFSIDGITGKICEETSVPNNDGSRISEANLFDIGADAIGLVVPGGDIAARIAMALLGKKK
jgi:hypothetical protein